MTELFTHVLVGYVLATMLSWRWGWITPPLVTVEMFGALLPDLNRLELFVPAETVEGCWVWRFRGRPFIGSVGRLW